MNTLPGGLLLCGGRSRRMGRPKELLTIDSRSVVEVLVERLRTVASPVVVSIRPDQSCLVPAGAMAVTDETPDAGPLEGVRIGLAHLREQAQWAFVLAVDLLGFDAALVPQLQAFSDGHDAVVPCICGQLQPLSALYRTKLSVGLDVIGSPENRSMRAWLKRLNVRWVDESELGGISAVSFTNVNTPEDWAGFQPG